MKRKFAILSAIFTLFVFLAIPKGMKGQTRVEEIYSTCLFGSDYNQQSVGSYTTTWTTTNGDFSWEVVNGNNNNNNWDYIKFGRKNYESIGQITTTTAYPEAITKVDLTIDAIVADKINSIKLYSGSSPDNITTLLGEFTKEEGTQTVTISDPRPGKYYDIKFDCASGSSNGLVTVSKVDYYHDPYIPGFPTTTVTIGDYIFNTDVYQGTEAGSLGADVQIDGFTLEGATVVWSSSNEDVATIESEEGDTGVYGVVTLVAAGTTTITAFYPGIEDVYMPAMATYELTVINSDPNVPGTENNPYTVAQARAAIDAGTGTQGVYATGIVSAIPTAYNSNYGNVTFNMVDEEGDEVFLQAYRCGGDEAVNVTIGDVVVVYGNLTKYGSIYEFGQGCQVISLEHSVNPIITVANATVDAPAVGAEGSLTVTYINIDEIVANVYFCDAEGVAASYDWITAEINDDDNVEYNVSANDGAARTAYLKVRVGNVYSNLVTINQEAYVAPALDYAELPFFFNGGKNDIEGTDGLSHDGLGSDYNVTTNPTTILKFDGTGDWLLLHFLESPGTLTFDIKGNSFSGGTFEVQTSEDGETYTTLATYTELGSTETKIFSDLSENIRYIKWNYTEKVSGNVGLGNIHLYEPGGGPVTEYDLTVEPFENLEIFTFVGGDENNPFEGAGTIQVTVGDQVMLSIAAIEGYVIQSLMVDGVEHVNDITDDETYTFFMPDHNVTISATAVEDVPFEPVTYTLATSIESGKTYIIVGSKEIDGETHYYAMGEQRNNNRGGVVISVDGTTATVETADVHEFVFNYVGIPEEPDFREQWEGAPFYSIYDNTDNSGYLYAASSTANHLKTESELDNDNNGTWQIHIDTVAHIAASNSNNRNVMQFNYNNNNPTIFSCYAEANQSPVYLYVKDEVTTTATQTIALVAGKNWISFNVEITLDDLKAALVAAVPGTAIKIQGKSASTTYNPSTGKWRGQLSSLDQSQMYKVELTAACEITLEGMPVDPAAYPITINANAATWLAFPLNESMTVTNAFNGFAKNGDQVKAKVGSTTYNETTGKWRGSLSSLQPGMGYVYISNWSEPRTFTFPTSASKVK